MRACPVCLRDNIKPGEPCGFCGGEGKVDQFYTCPNCHGQANGELDHDPCFICNGFGYLTESLFDDGMEGDYPFTEEDDQL